MNWEIRIDICILLIICIKYLELPKWHSVKESVCQTGVLGLIPGSERSPGGGNFNPLQYSCLENPMDKEAWQVIVHWVAKSLT